MGKLHLYSFREILDKIFKKSWKMVKFSKTVSNITEFLKTQDRNSKAIKKKKMGKFLRNGKEVF